MKIQTKNKRKRAIMKDLFLYPNQRVMSLVPPSIGLLSSLLKNRGVKVELFDTSTYLIEGIDTDEIREQNLTVKPTKPDKKLKREKKDVFIELNKKINEFKPDLIAVSATESTFLVGIKLLKTIKHKTLTILGGVFATFAPEKAISYPEIDIICVGEGEGAIVELCEKLSKNENYDNIKNLWIKKKDGTIIKNKIRAPVNLDENPMIDFDIFDEKRLYRMMPDKSRNKVYKMLPIETHRGCPYMCGYCDSPTQNEIYWNQTHKKFFRTRSLDKVREEILYYTKKYKADYIFFWADTFFTYSKEEIDKFCEMYKDINLPFYAQARPETITDYKVKRLKEVGLHRMGIGIEHGNEKFRREILNRYYTNKQLINSLKIVEKHKIPFSVNNIIGLPDETPQLVMDTIEINRRIPTADSTGCSIFQPYHGTKLRELSIKRGYITDDVIAPTNADSSILNMPNFPKERIAGLARTFNMYVRFPKSRWNEIKIAEQFTPEGNVMWKKLRKEFMSKFFGSGE